MLRINSDGELNPVGGGPVSSGGSKPVSITVHGNLVYVANAGDGGSNYTGFTLNPGGHLRPLAGSTVSLPDGSSPGDVLFNGDGTRLVGTRVGTSLIDSFTVGADGLLTAAAASPFAAQGLGPFGSEFSPTDPTQLFVSNAHNVGPGTGTISAFNDAADGTLTSIGSSPFADLQTAPCWVEISHDGKILFTVNTASSSISRFAIAADGSLSLLGSTPLGTSQCRCGGRSARPERWHALGRRHRRARRQRVRSRRRQPDGAPVVPDRTARRLRAIRHRRHLERHEVPSAGGGRCGARLLRH